MGGNNYKHPDSIFGYYVFFMLVFLLAGWICCVGFGENDNLLKLGIFFELLGVAIFVGGIIHWRLAFHAYKERHPYA